MKRMLLLILNFIFLLKLCACSNGNFEKNIERLKSNKVNERLQAIQSLIKAKDERSIIPIANLVDDSNMGVEIEAGKAMRELFSQFKGSFIDDIIILPHKTFSKIIQRIEITDNELGNYNVIRFINGTDSNIRANAVYLIGILKENDTLPILLNALKDRDRFVRRTAANSLYNIKNNEKWNDEKKIFSLVEAMSDEDVEIRRIVSMCLWGINRDEVNKAFFRGLSDSNDQVRENSVKGLAYNRNPQYLDYIMQMANETKNNSSITAVWFFGLLDPKDDTFSKAILSDNTLKKIAQNYMVFIKYGTEAHNELLIKSLNKFGGVKMAEDMMNFGNRKLQNAANDWAAKNKCIIFYERKPIHLPSIPPISK